MDFTKKGSLAALAFGLSLIIGTWFFALRDEPLKSMEVFTEGRSVFRLTLSTSSMLDLSKLKTKGLQSFAFPSLSDMQMTIEGDLHVKRSGQTVYLALLNNKAIVQGQQVNASDLIDPYFTVILDQANLPVSFQSGSHVKSSHYAFWLQLIGQLQVHRHDGRVSQWMAFENDYQSSFSARYSLSKDLLSKTKSQVTIKNRFTQLDSVVYRFEGEPQLTIKRGKERLIESEETIVAESDSHGFYRNSIRLRMIEQTSVPDSQNVTPKFPPVALNRILSLKPGALEALADRDTEESSFRNDLQGATLEQVLADLDRNLSHEEEMEFYKKLRAFLYLLSACAHLFMNPPGRWPKPPRAA